MQRPLTKVKIGMLGLLLLLLTPPKEGGNKYRPKVLGLLICFILSVMFYALLNNKTKWSKFFPDWSIDILFQLVIILFTVSTILFAAQYLSLIKMYYYFRREPTEHPISEEYKQSVAEKTNTLVEGEIINYMKQKYSRHD